MDSRCKFFCWPCPLEVQSHEPHAPSRASPKVAHKLPAAIQHSNIPEPYNLGVAATAPTDEESKIRTEATGKTAEGGGSTSGSGQWAITASFCAVYLANLLNVANFTIIIPTARAYSESLGSGGVLVGLAVGLHPFSQGLMNIPTAYLLQRIRFRTYLIGASIVYVFGNVLYALAGVTGSIWTLLVARVIVGAAGGPQLPTTYVARAFTLDQRSSSMLVMASANALAYAVGPFFALLIELTCDSLNFHGEVLNNRTAPGWLMALLSLALGAYVFVTFVEPPPFSTRKQAVSQANADAPLPIVELAAVHIIILILAIMIASWEVHLAYVAEAWGWSHKLIALYLCAVMLVMAPVSLAGGRLAKFVSDRAALRVFAASAVITSSLFFGHRLHVNKLIAVAIFTFASVGSVLFTTLERGFVQSLVTKIAPASSKQGVIGVFSCVWLCGRGLGAVAGAWLRHPIPYAWCIFSLMLIKLATVAITFKRLVPLAAS